MLAVNKIDVVDFSHTVFGRIADEWMSFAPDLGVLSAVSIPLSARFGDNVLRRSTKTRWYVGPTLVEHLDAVDVEADSIGKPFRLSVQWVNGPNHDFRGLAGTVA